MEISVIVPTYNRLQIVTRTLESLFSQSAHAKDYEVIVVVDGSTDGTADALRQLQPPSPFRVIEQQNRGPSAARNVGYLAADTELVLFIDDDMICDRDLVAAHIAAHKKDARTVALGSLFLSTESPPSLAAECFEREIGAFHIEHKLGPELNWQIADCVFSNTSLRRKLLQELGGFDETFRAREDLELGIRLFDAGVHPLYIGHAKAYQYMGKSSADLVRDAESFASGDVKLARKHPRTIVKGQLNWLAQNFTWKQRMLCIAATSPAFADFFLAPVCACGEAFLHVPALRNSGVRALQIRRRIHWFHKVLELGWRFSDANSETSQ